MTIDQRLEALTQTVELLAIEQGKTDKQLRRLGRYMRALALMVIDHEARLRSLEGNGDAGDDDEE